MSPRRRQLARSPGTPDAAEVKAVLRPAALAGALPAAAAGVRVVGSGVDTLHLFARGPVDHLKRRQLEVAQDEARARQQQLRDEFDGVPLDLAGHALNVRPHGARQAPFLLRQRDVVDVLVNPEAAAGFPTLTVEARALWLWQLGADRVAEDVDRIAAALLIRATPDAAALHVSRVDLAVDFQGWAPPPAEGFNDPTDEGVVRYVTRARDFSAHTKRRQFTGFSFGRGDVVCRLYDKTVEAEGSGKLDAMRAVWSAAPGFDEAAPVWRLEYQLRRPAIAQLRAGDGRELSTWEQLRPALRGLWQFLATRWCARRAPRTKTSRQALTPEWSALAGHGFAAGPWLGSQADVYRAHREEQAARLTPQLAGYLTRALAEEVYFAPGRVVGEVSDLTLDEAWPRIRSRVQAFADRRGAAVEDRAAEKVGRWDEAALSVQLAAPELEHNEEEEEQLA